MGDEFGKHVLFLMRSADVGFPAIRMMFERARREAPCLLIMEDLDSLITDANRSFFLNEVDGLEDNDGLLMVRPCSSAIFQLTRADRHNQPL